MSKKVGFTFLFYRLSATFLSDLSPRKQIFWLFRPLFSTSNSCTNCRKSKTNFSKI